MIDILMITVNFTKGQPKTGQFDYNILSRMCRIIRGNRKEENGLNYRRVTCSLDAIFDPCLDGMRADSVAEMRPIPAPQLAQSDFTTSAAYAQSTKIMREGALLSYD